MWRITAIESKNQVVILGQRAKSDPWSLYTFQNNPDGHLVETRMDAPCQHDILFNLTTVVQNGKELLAVSWSQCSDIKLIDLDTKRVTPVFKFPPHSLFNMCSGPDGGLFIVMESGNVQQLDNTFSIINTFDLSSFIPGLFPFLTLICYLPDPHNLLVVYFKSELKAVSLQNGHQVWSQPWEGFHLKCLLYCPQQDVLLAGVLFEPKIHVLNPSNGSVIQTIEIPDIYSIHRMCLCNNQIVMTQYAEEDSERRLLSYCTLNRIV